MRTVAVTCWIALLCTPATFAQAQEAPPAASQVGVVREVTLYRNVAAVTRVIPVEAKPGLQTITVPDLPANVSSDSVVADGDSKTVVRAVRVSPKVAGKSQREEVRALDAQIKELTAKSTELTEKLDVVTRDIQRLDQLINFTSEGGKADLNRGVLQADSLTKLLEFSMTKHRELASERFESQQELKRVTQDIAIAQQKRNYLARGPQRTQYEAQVFVESDKGGMLRLTYLVANCGWSPQYVVRGDADNAKVQLEYSALIRQMSGEDWNDVRLTLSTASPTVNSKGPTIAPLRVAALTPTSSPAERDPFGDPVKVAPKTSQPNGQSGQLPKLLQALRQRKQQAETTHGMGLGNADRTRDLKLNSLAGQLQQIELQTEWSSWQMLAPDATDNIIRQTYHAPQPVSLSTRQENQLVQIFKSDMEAEMYHVATPLLSSYAYREAQVTNSEPNGLLGGPAMVYLNDRFVGRAQIPPTASGQRLTIGFGADSQVRTRRELLNKEDAVQGGNRQLRFSYRLVLANFKSKPVQVRLMDRIPNARQSQQLSVRFESNEHRLSEDGLYQRVSRPNGILRWDLTLPKDRHGSDAFDVHYNFTMEFDRNQVPSTEHSLAEMQSEYENLSGMGGGGFAAAVSEAAASFELSSDGPMTATGSIRKMSPLLVWSLSRSFPVRLFEGTEFDRPPRCETCEELEEACVCPPPPPQRLDPAKQTARIAEEKRKRGKVVTTIRGLSAEGNDLPELLSQLKSACGAGGALKDDVIEIQGRQRERAGEVLRAIGYKVKG